MECILTIKDEVYVSVAGITDEHLKWLVNNYSKFTPSYKFHPQYRLGRWDGRIKFFQPNGVTYLFLVEDLVKHLTKMKYKINVIDHRPKISFPPLITADIFSNVIHPDTNEPLMLRDYQVIGVKHKVT